MPFLTGNGFRNMILIYW